MFFPEESHLFFCNSLSEMLWLAACEQQFFREYLSSVTSWTKGQGQQANRKLLAKLILNNKMSRRKTAIILI